MERAAAEDWIRAHVQPVGPIELAHERPWATVLRVPLADSLVWFKACSPVQAFEPRLTAELFARWPDRVPEVVAWDEQRRWLLLANPDLEIVYITSLPVDEAIVEYYMRFLPDPAGARRRLHLVVVGEDSGRALTAKVLDAPHVVG